MVEHMMTSESMQPRSAPQRTSAASETQRGGRSSRGGPAGSSEAETTHITSAEGEDVGAATHVSGSSRLYDAQTAQQRTNPPDNPLPDIQSIKDHINQIGLLSTKLPSSTELADFLNKLGMTQASLVTLEGAVMQAAHVAQPATTDGEP